MNLNEHTRQVTDLDSRRLATGLRCIILRARPNITGRGPEKMDFRGVLELMRTFGSIPPHVVIPPNTGIDVVGGYCLVCPKGALRFIEDQMKEMESDLDLAEREINDREAELEAIIRLDTIGEFARAAQEELDRNKHDKARRLDATKNDIELKAYQAIREHIYLAAIDVHALAGVQTSKVSGEDMDVYLHSKEQGQFHCELVRKNRDFIGDVERKWAK